VPKRFHSPERDEVRHSKGEAVDDRVASTPSAFVRLVAGVAGVVLGSLALALCLHNLQRPHALDAWLFWVPISLFLLTLAVLGGWFALRADRVESRAAIWSTWRGGALVGAVSFVLGFVGPLILQPHANLGPLLGIFVTGPLGFFIGALGALVLQKLRTTP
jgi:hypothetical protein